MGFRSTLNGKDRPSFAKKESNLRDGISRKRFDDIVATKRDLRSMPVGMAESGCRDFTGVVVIVSLFFSRAMAVEDNRTWNLMPETPSRPSFVIRLEATLLHRIGSMFAQSRLSTLMWMKVESSSGSEQYGPSCNHTISYISPVYHICSACNR